MYWILGFSIYLAIGCFFLALCLAAGRADEQADRMHDDLTER